MVRGFTSWEVTEFKAKMREAIEMFSVVQAETKEIVEF